MIETELLCIILMNFGVHWDFLVNYFPPPQCPHMSFVDFVVLPPGHGRSVTDFWGWDAHEEQLGCPDGVWVVIEEDVVPGGALNLKSTNLPRPWSPRVSSPSRKIPTVEPGIEPGTSWLVIRDWPLDHEAGRKLQYCINCLYFNIILKICILFVANGGEL